MSGIINRASLPQEFFDTYSARLLVQPEPQYLHAMLFKMSLGASFDAGGALGMPIPGRQFGGNGAEYASATDGRLVLADGIYDQAVMFIPELGNGPGHTVRMNRPAYQNTTYTQVSREVGSGTAISTTPTKVGSEQTSITLRRFAGPYDPDQSSVAPYGIDRFDSSVMFHRAQQIVGANLVRDFDKTLDTFGVLLFDQANTIVRPSGFAADNDHVLANDGPMTWSLLQSTERQLDEANIPYFPNGKRVLVLHPRQCEQLGYDPTFQRLVRYYGSMNPAFQGTYFGSIGTWDLFKSNTLTKITNTNSVVVYYAQAFGPGAVGAGAGNMPHVAFHSNDNYGEAAYVIWLWYAGFEVLDTRFIASIRTS